MTIFGVQLFDTFFRYRTLLLWTVFSLGCSGGNVNTDTDASLNGNDPTDRRFSGRNVIIEFNDNGCKGIESGYYGGVLQTVDSNEYHGLFCLSLRWTTEDYLLLDIINLIANCDYPGRPDWIAEGIYDESNGLSLSVVFDSYAPFGCGCCLYDWSFRLKDTPKVETLDIDISIRECSDDTICSTQHQVTTLRTNYEETLIACRYADLNIINNNLQSVYGSYNMLPTEDGSCDLGLTLSNLGRCTKTCVEDSDCKPIISLKCDNGLCLLPEDSW